MEGRIRFGKKKENILCIILNTSESGLMNESKKISKEKKKRQRNQKEMD